MTASSQNQNQLHTKIIRQNQIVDGRQSKSSGACRHEKNRVGQWEEANHEKGWEKMAEIIKGKDGVADAEGVSQNWCIEAKKAGNTGGRARNQMGRG